MASDDRLFYEARAEAELKLARKAEHPAAVKAHYTLAGLYLDRIHGGAEGTDVGSPR